MGGVAEGVCELEPMPEVDVGALVANDPVRTVEDIRGKVPPGWRAILKAEELQ